MNADTKYHPLWIRSHVLCTAGIFEAGTVNKKNLKKKYKRLVLKYMHVNHVMYVYIGKTQQIQIC